VERWPTRLLALLIAAVLVADLAMAVRPRQVRAYLTHWTRGPDQTEPYGPYPVDGIPGVRLAVAGDIGDSGDRLDSTAGAVESIAGPSGFDALLLLGDNVYPRGNPALLPLTVYGPFGPLLDEGTRLLAILGNHDVKDGHGPDQMEALGMPGRWWATTIGDVLLVGLDSTQTADPVQRSWLERTLRRSSAPWKIVALHHPPFSAGYQGSSTEAREAFAPLFERYGVQLVLSGHDHDYQRNHPIGGVTYVVSGAGAGTRRTSSDWFTDVSCSYHHFLELAVFEDALVVRAIDQERRVVDEATIPRVAPAAGHADAVAAGAACSTDVPGP
jgi:hypothetical protein